ncbi:MAG: hypothetical protein ACFFAN_06570 [Promethearchaeota archaeon]
MDSNIKLSEIEKKILGFVSLVDKFNINDAAKALNIDESEFMQKISELSENGIINGSLNSNNSIFNVNQVESLNNFEGSLQTSLFSPINKEDLYNLSENLKILLGFIWLKKKFTIIDLEEFVRNLPDYTLERDKYDELQGRLNIYFSMYNLERKNIIKYHRLSDNDVTYLRSYYVDDIANVAKNLAIEYGKKITPFIPVKTSQATSINNGIIEWDGKTLQLPPNEKDPPEKIHLCVVCQKKRGKTLCVWCKYWVCKKCLIEAGLSDTSINKDLKFEIGTGYKNYFTFCRDCFDLGKTQGLF